MNNVRVAVWILSFQTGFWFHTMRIPADEEPCLGMWACVGDKS